MTNLTPDQIQQMVSHWLATTVNGYLGSSYGADCLSLLQKPLQAGLADTFIAKLRRDVPALAMLEGGQINLYAYGLGSDALQVVLNVAGMEFEVRT